MCTLTRTGTSRPATPGLVALRVRPPTCAGGHRAISLPWRYPEPRRISVFVISRAVQSALPRACLSGPSMVVCVTHDSDANGGPGRRRSVAVTPKRRPAERAEVPIARVARLSILVFLIYYTALDAIGSFGVARTIITKDGHRPPDQLNTVIKVINPTSVDPAWAASLPW
jgi:hypothetical protein